MRLEASWEEFEHEADVGVRFRAPTPAGLFETAVEAMYGLCLDGRPPAAARVDRIEIAGHGLEDVLFEWLREILARLMADGVVYGAFDFERLDAGGLVAVARGEDLDPESHGLFTELKGLTGHEFALREIDGGLEGRAIFDV